MRSREATQPHHERLALGHSLTHSETPSRQGSWTTTNCRQRSGVLLPVLSPISSARRFCDSPWWVGFNSVATAGPAFVSLVLFLFSTSRLLLLFPSPSASNFCLSLLISTQLCLSPFASDIYFLFVPFSCGLAIILIYCLQSPSRCWVCRSTSPLLLLPLFGYYFLCSPSILLLLFFGRFGIRTPDVDLDERKETIF